MQTPPTSRFTSGSSSTEVRTLVLLVAPGPCHPAPYSNFAGIPPSSGNGPTEIRANSPSPSPRRRIPPLSAVEVILVLSFSTRSSLFQTCSWESLDFPLEPLVTGGPLELRVHWDQSVSDVLLGTLLALFARAIASDVGTESLLFSRQFLGGSSMG